MDEQTFFLRQQFSDFEAYCESARHWDLDYNQLDCGDFTSERLMFGSATTIFSHTKLGRRMLQRGATPAGLITFGILANPNINIHWRNYDICGDKLLIFPPGGELYSITQPDFDVFALSLSEEALNQTCHSFELPDFNKLVDANEYLTAIHRVCCSLGSGFRKPRLASPSAPLLKIVIFCSSVSRKNSPDAWLPYWRKVENLYSNRQCADGTRP